MLDNAKLALEILLVWGGGSGQNQNCFMCVETVSRYFAFEFANHLFQKSCATMCKKIRFPYQTMKQQILRAISYWRDKTFAFQFNHLNKTCVKAGPMNSVAMVFENGNAPYYKVALIGR